MSARAFLREARERQRADAERRTAVACVRCDHAPTGAACLECATALVLESEDAEREAIVGLFGRHRKVTGPAAACGRCDGWGWWLKENYYGEADFVECLACDGTGHAPEETA